MTTTDRVAEFLSQKTIAVCGVSRDSKKTANFIYRKLRGEGYGVVPVNRNATTVEGDPCYHDLSSIPTRPQAVIIVTRPADSVVIARECADLGIKYVWMHNGIVAKESSVSGEAVAICRSHHIHPITAGCPAMYCRHADAGHRFFRWLFKVTGRIPRNAD
jgi:predicted CoA-binding protein